MPVVYKSLLFLTLARITKSENLSNQMIVLRKQTLSQENILWIIIICNLKVPPDRFHSQNFHQFIKHTLFKNLLCDSH